MAHQFVVCVFLCLLEACCIGVLERFLGAFVVGHDAAGGSP